MDLTYHIIVANKKTGKAHWEANYIFSQTEREVLNKIDATFESKDGKIASTVIISIFIRDLNKLWDPKAHCLEEQYFLRIS